jgi:hypothetical protein
LADAKRNAKAAIASASAFSTDDLQNTQRLPSNIMMAAMVIAWYILSSGD